MKAILNRDTIVSYTIDEGGIEVGSPPAKVGIERLRFDGYKLIDLANESEIWVKHIEANAFELHCIDIGGCQLVTMTYRDRKKLINENGAYRLKTAGDIEIERIAEINCRARARMVKKIKGELGSLEEFQIHSLAFILALIVYVRNEPPALGEFFDRLIPHFKAMFPMKRWEHILMKSARKLMSIIEEYDQNIK